MTNKSDWKKIKNNPQKLKRKSLSNKIWRKKNRDMLVKQQREDYKKNPEKYVQYRKDFLKDHKNDPVFRKRQRLDSTRRNKALKIALLKLIGEKCVKCGYSDIRALQFDHRFGDGKEDRKKFRANQFYRFYLSHPEKALKKLQTLCANCNHIKRIENNEFRKPIYAIKMTIEALYT